MPNPKNNPKPTVAPSAQSEIREDYVHDRQVIIAPGRAKRPHETSEPSTKAGPVHDTFSPENLRGTKALLTVGGEKHWQIKVIKNIYPVVTPDNPRAYGYQEVVVETPKYGVELSTLPVKHIANLLRVYGRRTKALQRDKNIRYILIFKNNGGRAGASINHAHSQIFASQYVPPHIIVRRERGEEYRIQHNRDYYSDLLIQEERGPRWIASGSHVCALAPYASLYNYEAWIMPWRRVDNVSLLNPGELREMASYLKTILLKVGELGLPYNFYLHQVVGDRREHMYLRVAPRRDVWAGVELGSRLVVNAVPPEEAAAFFRAAFNGKPRT